jgi:predicted PurR-regulated permease PerM
MRGRSGYFIKIAIGSILAVMGIAFLAHVFLIIKIVIIAAVLAYILNPLANFLESRGMTRTGATVALFLFISAFIVISYSIFSPVLSHEIQNLQNGFSSENAKYMLSRFENFLVSHLSFLGIRDLNLVTGMENSMAKTGEWMVNHFMDAASVITSMILIPFVVFFLLKDGREFKRAFVSIMPNRYFEFTLYMFYKLNSQIGNYLRGQFIDALVVGILSVFSLWLLDVKYFFLIGVFAGFANLIPYFGPIMGASLAILVSMLQTGSFEKVLSVIGAFIIIKLIDDIFIQPLIVARTVHMHPLTVFLSVLIGGKLFGVLGMFLSVPVVGFVKVVTQESIVHCRTYSQG